jgi:hypothetical protein
VVLNQFFQYQSFKLLHPSEDNIVRDETSRLAPCRCVQRVRNSQTVLSPNSRREVGDF